MLPEHYDVTPGDVIGVYSEGYGSLGTTKQEQVTTYKQHAVSTDTSEWPGREGESTNQERCSFTQICALSNR